jgi:chloramphenicol 3-O phosphotransferase
VSYGQVILLDGASSAGKTTLARALQASLEAPYYLVQLDAFEDMVPARLLTGNAEEFEALTLCSRAMHRTVATLSRAGANVIADHLFLDAPGFDTWLDDCLEALRDLPVLFVGVRCPVHVLERRELERGDRDVGQARWQSSRVHRHGTYDVEVDTDASRVADCAAAVQAGLVRSGGAFEALRRRRVGADRAVGGTTRLPEPDDSPKRAGGPALDGR